MKESSRVRHARCAPWTAGVVCILWGSVRPPLERCLESRQVPCLRACSRLQWVNMPHKQGNPTRAHVPGPLRASVRSLLEGKDQWLGGVECAHPRLLTHNSPPSSTRMAATVRKTPGRSGGATAPAAANSASLCDAPPRTALWYTAITLASSS